MLYYHQTRKDSKIVIVLAASKIFRRKSCEWEALSRSFWGNHHAGSVLPLERPFIRNRRRIEDWRSDKVLSISRSRRIMVTKINWYFDWWLHQEGTMCPDSSWVLREPQELALERTSRRRTRCSEWNSRWSIRAHFWIHWRISHQGGGIVDGSKGFGNARRTRLETTKSVKKNEEAVHLYKSYQKQILELAITAYLWMNVWQ